MKEPLLNDHIKMVSRNGKEKQVPIWQIRQWIGAGVFDPAIPKGNQVGYDFVDQKKALADIQTWDANERRKRNKSIQGSGIPEPVDQGIAEVTLGRKRAEDPAFTAPPVPNVGDEELGKGTGPAPANPRDVI